MRTVSGLALAGGLAGLATIGFGALSMPASADPGGNNGTVKISEIPIDSIPDNDPHVGCALHVQWYGFDDGATSTISFELVDPTEGTVSVDGPVTVDLEADPAHGGHDPDGDVVYTMHPDAIPHPQQGFHEKITVNTTWSNGSDKKSKVIWFKDCASTTPPSSPPPTAETSTPPSTVPSTPPSTVPSAPSSAPSSSVPTSAPSAPAAPVAAVPSVSPTTSSTTATRAPEQNDAPSPSPVPSDSAAPPTVIDAGLAGDSSDGSSGHRTGLWLGAASACAATLGLLGLTRRRGSHRR